MYKINYIFLFSLILVVVIRGQSVNIVRDDTSPTVQRPGLVEKFDGPVRGPHGAPLSGMHLEDYDGDVEKPAFDKLIEEDFELTPYVGLNDEHKVSNQNRFSPNKEDVTLVDGSSPSEGTVLIRINGKWGSICDDSWNLENANVICRSLGYPYALRATTRDYFASTGYNDYVLDHVSCKGNETDIKQCKTWNYDSCKSREEAGVICLDDKKKEFEYDVNNPSLDNVTTLEAQRMRQQDYKVHFVKAYTNGAGILVAEVPDDSPYGGSKRLFGTICIDRFQGAEANVACRQSGQEMAHSFSRVAVTDPIFSENSPLLRIGHCFGNETSLNQCVTFASPNGVSCSTKRYAIAVRCTENKRKLPDIEPDAQILERSAYVSRVSLRHLTCALEENCFPESVYGLINRIGESALQQSRRLLRFSSVVYNKGQAAFKPHAPRDQWVWHQCHMHFHSMRVFSSYEIVDTERRKLATGHKASFCLEDNMCRPGYRKNFVCSTTLSNRGDQGISPGCQDNYMHDYDCQWIDITDVPPGNYQFNSIFNPDFLVPESDYSNNAVSCQLKIESNGVSARVYNCKLAHPRNL